MLAVDRDYRRRKIGEPRRMRFDVLWRGGFGIDVVCVYALDLYYPTQHCRLHYLQLVGFVSWPFVLGWMAGFLLHIKSYWKV